MSWSKILAWQIVIDAAAQKDFAKLDKSVEKRIRKYLEEEVIGKYDNPRAVGGVLHGKHYGEYWKYRIGDFRVVAKIEDDKLIIIVVKVAHRSKVYREK
ncbi:MAG: type II toxin-antitoxin system RelE/ParE family toxin [Neisseriaceae bacterium]|nr:type II toxin-antitoxin system RelE/ParE family toxin [Neisseriaceae bacterium]